MNPYAIRSVHGREILDSRGCPTVEAVVTLQGGAVGRAAAPSGASAGTHEARPLYDGNKARFNGRGTTKAVHHVNTKIAAALRGIDAAEPAAVDHCLAYLDKTEGFSSLGANAVLAVSLACARAASAACNLPLYRFLGGSGACTLPVPMVNVLGGGVHCPNNIDIQEFMVLPIGASTFRQGMEWCCRIYRCLGSLLEERRLGCAVGDEGAFAPELSRDEDALPLILQAIERCGLYPGSQVVLAIDAAASQWYTGSEQGYLLPKRQLRYTTQELLSHWEGLCAQYPIFSLEDPFGEEDWPGFTQLTHRLGRRVQVVGDDLFTTNAHRLRQGIAVEAANAVLLKPNQSGTLTGTIEAAQTAQTAGWSLVVSHRSGETEDTTIADLAVALHAGQIKAGAPCRGERIAKYNRLLRIEEALGHHAAYAGMACRSKAGIEISLS